MIDTVFVGDCRKLLRQLSTASVDAVITDAMYGVKVRYDWGNDPGGGNPLLHWKYHQPIYEECLRVLKPKGALAWGQGFSYANRFGEWFGGYSVWPLLRARVGRLFGNIWIVQTRERQPIEAPTNRLIFNVDAQEYNQLKTLHPCPKPIEEMLPLVENLTKPGDVILDFACGLGSTLVAAKRLSRHYIGCDLSLAYCRVAMRRLANTRHHKTQ